MKCGSSVRRRIMASDTLPVNVAAGGYARVDSPRGRIVTEGVQPPRHRSLSRGYGDAALDILIEAIEVVSRELGRSVPAPRGAPFYALEYAPGDLTPLDVLCLRGIFRKYEHALHIGAGLGAPARWWATHFGCSVVGVDWAPGRARAAARLTARGGLAAQVRFVAADAAALPLRARFFTHVWASDALRMMSDPTAALHEAWRVLRPGAHFGLHVGVGAAGARSPADWCERLAAARFVDVSWQPAADPRVSQVVQVARRRLERVLNDWPSPLAAQLAIDYAVACEAALRERPMALVFARRPA